MPDYIADFGHLYCRLVDCAWMAFLAPSPTSETDEREKTKISLPEHQKIAS